MGCGIGDITEDLVKWKDLKDVNDSKQLRDGVYQDKGSLNKEILGTDISLQMINFCKEERKKTLEDVLEDPVKLSFAVVDSGDPAALFWKDKKEKFDLVTSLTALHWIADQRKALECVTSWLKPGGHFLIHLFLRKDALYQSQENLKVH
jgi:SAM-dependent methyltransferase